MFKGNKTATAIQDKKEVAELIDLQVTSLKTIDGWFAEAESTADIGEKIVKLEKLKNDISNAGYAVANERDAIAAQRAKINHKIKCLFDGSRWNAEYDEKNKLLEDPRFGDFVKTINAQSNRAKTTLKEIIENCDLEEVSDSPLFTKVYKDYEHLRDRFAAETARQAVTGNRKPATAAAAIATTRKKTGTAPKKAARNIPEIF